MVGVVLLLLVPFLHLTDALGASCSHPCVPISECVSLLQLLKTNQAQDIKKVQDATCSFIDDLPLVCCPADITSNSPDGPSSGAPHPPQPLGPSPSPSPRPPSMHSLLPNDCGHFANDDRIIDGNETRIGHYPWMAALGYRVGGSRLLDFKCGGSVISERYVLTAAHCMLDVLPEVVRLGEWDLNTEFDCEITVQGFEFCAPFPAVDYTYDEIISHPDYNTRSAYSDDIALIRLSSPIDFKANPWIKPVCLQSGDLALDVRAGIRKSIVTGWGFTEKRKVSPRLLQAFLPVVDIEACNKIYKGRLTNGQLCAGGADTQDSCGGDSGGPLVVAVAQGPPYHQIGIVSFGPRACGTPNVPGVYTAVAHYIGWIEQHMNP